MINRVLWIVCLVAAVAFTQGCKTTKKTGTLRSGSEQQALQRVNEVLERGRQMPRTISGRVEVSLTTGGSTLSSKGDLKIVPHQGILISLQPFLGIELFRLVITPETLIVIDRTKKRYLAQPLVKLGRFAGSENPFYLIESLFLNRLFVPGKETCTIDDFSKFNLTEGEEFVVKMEKMMKDKSLFSFEIDRENLLTKTELAIPAGNAEVGWSYRNFATEGSYSMPLFNELTGRFGDKQATLKIEVSKYEYDKKITIDESLPTKYEEITLESLIKTFVK